MPGNHVHFALTNAVYSADSVTSSSSLTVSSLPSLSSSALSTLPDEDEPSEPSLYPLALHAMQIELNPDIEFPKYREIHFLLAYTPYTNPALPYDLSWPFSPSNTNAPWQSFAEPATFPPLSSITLIHPALKLNIEVLPSAPFPGSYVSVIDVFTCLYRNLRLAVCAAEYDELPREVRRAVSRAYYRRCERILDPAARMQETRKGLKKIDLLMGCTRFIGLAGTLIAPDVWEIMLGEEPRRTQDIGFQALSSLEVTHGHRGAASLGPLAGTSEQSRDVGIDSDHTMAIDARKYLEHRTQDTSIVEDTHDQRSAASSVPSTSMSEEACDISMDHTLATDTWRDFEHRTQDIGSFTDDTHELDNATPSVPLAGMFEQARDFSISGGEFYSVAGSMNIDASQIKVASTHSMSITNLWHASNQTVFPANGGQQLDCQTQHNERAPAHFCDTSLGENGTTDRGESRESGQDYSMSCKDLQVEMECSDSLVDRITECDRSELEEGQLQVTESEIVISSPTPLAQMLIVDEFVSDVLSSYPLQPTGDLLSFQHIVNALLFSFSPLSPTMLAALLKFEDAQHVKRILLPASPLISIPKPEDNEEENEDRTSIHFVDPSIVDFFLDRTRSGRYYVDGPSAHRVLLDGCTLVMEKMYEEDKEEWRFDRMDWRWRDTFEYACRNWERHRRAGARSKL